MLAEITVRGSFSAARPPERGTVYVSIGYEGPAMEPVYARVARDLDEVQSSVAELTTADEAAVTWWAAEHLRTWSTRPWNQDGKQLPPVHHASVSMQVKFRDFAALSAWVGQHISYIEGFRVGRIEWALTAGRREELVREVRAKAVHDALDRAQQYADALGLGPVSPVEIADAGMLATHLRPDGGHGAYTVARVGSSQSGSGSGVELVPSDIEVTASVDARFVVHGLISQSPAVDIDKHPKPALGAECDLPADLSVGEFRDDDAGYVAWLSAHPNGYVVNIARSYSATQARVHRAACRSISGENPHGGPWTGPYVKVCAEDLAALDEWASSKAGEPISRCGACHPARNDPHGTSLETAGGAVATLASQGRSEVHGPQHGSAVVEAWAEDYIRFEKLPEWQKGLREEIRSRCRQLDPSAEQILHATFFGAKLSNADVENVLLYYIDSFRVAGKNGIRFEHGTGVPPAPKGTQYGFCYRYGLAPRSGAFTHWRHGATLASFDWTDLGSFAGEKQLAQVWLAVSRGAADVFSPAAPEAPFAARIQIRPPVNRQPVWGALLKGVFDGVICAFQAHIDTTNLPEVTARLASALPADANEIEDHLLDQRRAVLGAVGKLVSPYRAGVKWDPSDHRCVAGELLAAESIDNRWSIKGEIVELSR